MYYEENYKEEIEEIYANIPESYDSCFDEKANSDLDRMKEDCKKEIAEILEDIINSDDGHILKVFEAYKKIQECQDYIASSWY